MHFIRHDLQSWKGRVPCTGPIDWLRVWTKRSLMVQDIAPKRPVYARCCCQTSVAQTAGLDSQSSGHHRHQWTGHRLRAVARSRCQFDADSTRRPWDQIAASCWTLDTRQTAIDHCRLTDCPRPRSDLADHSISNSHSSSSTSSDISWFPHAHSDRFVSSFIFITFWHCL